MFDSVARYATVWLSKKQYGVAMDENIIGDNIRALRTGLEVSLTELARRASLDKSTLSKIERGNVSSPVSTLIRIAEAMGVPLVAFFDEHVEEPDYALTRKGEARIIAGSGTRFGYSYEALALGLQHKKAEPFLLTIQPGDPEGHFQHAGEEFIYMISGRMEFSVGDEKLILRAGDALYFNATTRHATRLLGTKPAKFVCVFIFEPGAKP